MIAAYFLFALIAAIAYYFLYRIPLLARILVAFGVFVCLSLSFSALILKIDDAPPDNSIVVTPEMLKKASGN
ncbi:MAG: hypothetical protein ACRECW_18555 [Phyllobacterium sp.]